MPNEITSILQPLTTRHKSHGKVPGSSAPPAVEKPAAMQADRVSVTDSARLMQRAESGQGTTKAAQSGLLNVNNIYVPAGSPPPSTLNQLSAAGSAQRPSPAMANMLDAFLMTSDMEGFNQNSDLNADGVINFQDLAALRDRESSANMVPSDSPKARLHNMSESFLDAKGSEGFDGTSDLNDDGMINFHDLAILRSKMQSS